MRFLAAIMTAQIPDLRPPKGTLAPSLWEQPWFWASLGFAAAALAIFGGLLWWNQRQRGRTVSAPAPEIVARQALRDLSPQVETDAVLTEVSRIVHQYLEQIAGLAREERTTEELLNLLGPSPFSQPETLEAIRGFLDECDRRKYSPAQNVPAASAMAERALSLVEQIESRRQDSVSVNPPVSHNTPA
jgi:hypothetical protein